MDEKLKQRLTGAAILIALLVLVVPELFRGQNRSEPPKGDVLPNAQPNALPRRAVTIQLQQTAGDAGGGTGSSSGAATLAVSAEQHPDPAAAAAAEQRAVATSAAAAEAVEAARTREGGQTAAGVPAGSPAPAAAGNAAAVHSPANPPTAARAAPTPASRTATAPAGAGWYIQLGVFAQRANAERLLKQASAKGLEVTLNGPDARGQYRVRGVTQKDHSAAQRTLQKVQAAGFPGNLIQAP